MAGRLDGRVAVITGGASGMGRATAQRFLAEGASVVIADLNEATGKEAMELAAARGAGPRVRFVRTNVAEEADVAAMIAFAQDEFGRLDCLFNNAGVGGALGSLLETEVEDWDFTFAVLVRSVFLGIKHGARVMKAQGAGAAAGRAQAREEVLTWQCGPSPPAKGGARLRARPPRPAANRGVPRA